MGKVRDVDAFEHATATAIGRGVAAISLGAKIRVAGEAKAGGDEDRE